MVGPSFLLSIYNKYYTIISQLLLLFPSAFEITLGPVLLFGNGRSEK